jgi:hypothetical protein
MGYRATKRDKKYLKLFKQGKSIGFTMMASLKAKGLIPRANGTRRVSKKYRRGGGDISDFEECPSGSSTFFGGPCKSGSSCIKDKKPTLNEDELKLRWHCIPKGL